jgi:hypothetical protein
MSRPYRLSLFGDCLLVQTERPARVLFRYDLPRRHGVHLLEPIGPCAYRLPAKFMPQLRVCARDGDPTRYRVMVELADGGRCVIGHDELRHLV